MWKIGITDQTPTPCLIGLDLSEHVRSVLVTTHSQKQKREASEEKYKLYKEIIRGNEADETADLVVIWNPHENTFRREQKEDSTLEQCFKMVREGPITPESPERYFVEKDLLYREVLVNPEGGGKSFHKQQIIPTKYKE